MPHFFDLEQGNLLIRLLLAHIASDFLFQSDSMVKSKHWYSSSMFFHLFIVFALTYLFSGLLVISLILTALHWAGDSVKLLLQKKYPQKVSQLFLGDQIVHVISILLLWSWQTKVFSNLIPVVLWTFHDYKASLLLLGYAIIIWPADYFLRFTLEKINRNTKKPGNGTNDIIDEESKEEESKIEHGGKLIGIFERIIILTLVLLNQYEAIGFLVAGKGIMRFAQQNENIRSEYVLVGTMMSYAISISTGVLINWLLSLLIS